MDPRNGIRLNFLAVLENGSRFSATADPNFPTVVGKGQTTCERSTAPKPATAIIDLGAGLYPGGWLR